MCKPDTNAGGAAGHSRILLFSLNHSEPTLAAQLTAFPDPGRVSVRDLPASGAPLSRGYEGNWPLRGISSEGKHLPHSMGSTARVLNTTDPVHTTACVLAGGSSLNRQGGSRYL